MKPKKKKRKKSKKKSPPKPRSAIDVARNPQPYQFPLYTPPFPSVINHQPKANANSQNVANTFRNIQAVNAKELERLRGDLTAYRQESQTIFKKLVAFPRNKVYYDNETVSDLTDSEEEIEDAKERLIDEEETKIVKGILEQEEEEREREGMGAEDIDVGADNETVSDLTDEEEEIEDAKERLIDEEETKIVKGILEQEKQQEKREAMEQEDIDVGDVFFGNEPSVGEETLMGQAGRGAGTLTEQASATSSKKQGKNKTMVMLKQELQSQNIPFPPKIKAKELREFAQGFGISSKI